MDTAAAHQLAQGLTRVLLLRSLRAFVVQIESKSSRISITHGWMDGWSVPAATMRRCCARTMQDHDGAVRATIRRCIRYDDTKTGRTTASAVQRSPHLHVVVVACCFYQYNDMIIEDHVRLSRQQMCFTSSILIKDQLVPHWLISFIVNNWLLILLV